MAELITIVDCFETQAEKYKERIAIKTKKNTLTYGSLNNLANLITQQILDSCPDKLEPDGQTIAMIFEHDADMIAGIMGILKAGKIYVALDPTYPVGRLSYILGDSKARFIITNDNNLSLAEELSSQADYPVRIFNINSIDVNREAKNPDIEINPEQAAYILYTSGSTGKPKGVVQSHKNILHFIRCFINDLQITFSDRLALFTSYSHTMAAIDIFSILLSGAALYPYDIKLEGNMGKLAGWIREEEITIYHSVPTIYRYFIETITGREQVSTIRAIVVGGEAIYKNDIDLYKRYFSDTCIFVNLFGSSELIIAMLNIITKDIAITNASVPVGYFARGVDALLLDENGVEVGTNGIGELVYRSSYLSPGYWNLEKLTQEIFSKDVPGGEARTYRSGDLGRILSNGSFEYIGRKDFQVKISGNRVESGEIEAKLLNHPTVREAAVIAKQNPGGNNYLCAFIVADRELTPSELRQHLEKEVPDYMVPSYFIRLEKMPLTENGKLDRKGLQEINLDISISREYEPPADEIEGVMLEVWKKILDLDQLGVNNSFFDMGGNSILAIKFEVEMEKRGISLKSNDVYQFKTIRQLAFYIKDQAAAGSGNGENAAVHKSDTLQNSVEIKPGHMEETGGGRLANRKSLDNILPFNDVFYRTCYLNALIPVVKHFNKSILPLLVNDIISYGYKNIEDQKILEYIPVKPLNSILNELGLKFETKAESRDLIGDIKSAISEGRPVILWIDCFYSPARADMYQKHHWEHCMVVYGYDNDQQVCNIIEHRHKDNLSYEQQVMKYQDILNCCKGYTDNFYIKKIDMPVYLEFYPDAESSGSSREESPHSYIHQFAGNMSCKKEDLFAGIETLKAYRRDFGHIISNRELLDKNTDNMLTALNQAINIKQVERYRLDKLFGGHLRVLELLDEIAEKWEYIRKVVAKYMYSSVYDEGNFNAAAENIGHIHELEIRFNKELFSLLNLWKV